MFVGRTREVALLRTELRAAAGGAARRVLVEGPEGIGKTALVHRALDGEAGARVLTVSGEEGERDLPLGVLRQIAEEAVRLGLGATGAPTGRRSGRGSCCDSGRDSGRGSGRGPAAVPAVVPAVVPAGTIGLSKP
ncbi:AAA family ATPase [Nonomuraea antimicrobica]